MIKKRDKIMIVKIPKEDGYHNFEPSLLNKEVEIINFRDNLKGGWYRGINVRFKKPVRYIGTINKEFYFLRTASFFKVQLKQIKK